MGRFTKNFNVEIEFDGDKVELTLRRLRNDHMVKLGPYFRESDGEVKLTFVDKITLVNAAAEILPDCIVEIKGLKDDAGNALGLQDIVGELYFAKLFDFIIGELLQRSLAGKLDLKKSAAPSPGTPPEQGGGETTQTTKSVESP